MGVDHFVFAVGISMAPAEKFPKAVDVRRVFATHSRIDGDKSTPTRRQLSENVQPPGIFVNPLRALRQEQDNTIGLLNELEPFQPRFVGTYDLNFEPRNILETFSEQRHSLGKLVGTKWLPVRSLGQQQEALRLGFLGSNRRHQGVSKQCHREDA